MTYTEIGVRLVVLLLVVGVCRNVLGPALKRMHIPGLNDFVKALNGDTYADGKHNWE